MRTSSINHVLTSAPLAAMVGAVWTLPYLFDTVYGSGGHGATMLAIAMGNEHGIGADGAEALFVVLTRFILGFGITWAPLAALASLFDRPPAAS